MKRLIFILIIAMLTLSCAGAYYGASTNYHNYAPFIRVTNAWGTVVYADYANYYEVKDGDLIINGRTYSAWWYTWEIAR